jgi:hypothetical protein
MDAIIVVKEPIEGKYEWREQAAGPVRGVLPAFVHRNP